jgi:hypothetical protein
MPRTRTNQIQKKEIMDMLKKAKRVADLKKIMYKIFLDKKAAKAAKAAKTQSVRQSQSIPKVLLLTSLSS